MQNSAFAAQVKPLGSDAAPIHTPSTRRKQYPSRALRILMDRHRDDFQHCLDQLEWLETLHSEYLDEALTIKAEMDRLRPTMMTAALRDMREIMARKHPDFEGALAIPRPLLGDA